MMRHLNALRDAMSTRFNGEQMLRVNMSPRDALLLAVVKDHLEGAIQEMERARLSGLYAAGELIERVGQSLKAQGGGEA